MSSTSEVEEFAPTPQASPLKRRASASRPKSTFAQSGPSPSSRLPAHRSLAVGLLSDSLSNIMAKGKEPATSPPVADTTSDVLKMDSPKAAKKHHKHKKGILD